MEIFIYNKYYSWYYNIINNVKNQQRIKTTGDLNQFHHIIPRSLGGSDHSDNIVLLTYKEHRVCHRLLIEMTRGNSKIKMSHAYSWFGKSAGVYKTGKDNNFSKPEIIEIVRQRMIDNNPMKAEHQRNRMKINNNNPHSKSFIHDKEFFNSLSEAARKYNTTIHIIKKAIKENISILESQSLYQKVIM